MHLSEVLNARVRTADGEDLGRVADVRLVQDGPMLPLATQQALRVDGILVTRRGPLFERFGLDRREAMTGPWPLTAIARVLHRSLRLVPWADIDGVADGVVRLREGVHSEASPDDP